MNPSLPGAIGGNDTIDDALESGMRILKGTSEYSIEYISDFIADLLNQRAKDFDVEGCKWDQFLGEAQEFCLRYDELMVLYHRIVTVRMARISVRSHDHHVAAMRWLMENHRDHVHVAVILENLLIHWWVSKQWYYVLDVYLVLLSISFQSGVGRPVSNNLCVSIFASSEADQILLDLLNGNASDAIGVYCYCLLQLRISRCMDSLLQQFLGFNSTRDLEMMSLVFFCTAITADPRLLYRSASLSLSVCRHLNRLGFQLDENALMLEPMRWLSDHSSGNFWLDAHSAGEISMQSWMRCFISQCGDALEFRVENGLLQFQLGLHFLQDSPKMERLVDSSISSVSPSLSDRLVDAMQLPLMHPLLFDVITSVRKIHVLDTNVLLRHSKELDRLLNTRSSVTVVLPVTVINELFNHSKSTASLTRGFDPREAAKEAISKLVDWKRARLVQALTIEGRIVDDFECQWIEEQWPLDSTMQEVYTCDDAILHAISCVSDLDVVLVTEDLNLLIRARSLDFDAVDWFTFAHGRL